MKKIILVASICVLIIGLLAAVSCGSSGSTKSPLPTQSNAVNIQNLAFSPSALTIQAGTTVTWTNKDSTTHTVTSDTGAFDSGSIGSGGTFSYTFNNKGTFAYHCSNHPTMHGTVTVQ